MGVKDDSNAGEDVNTCRVLALLDAGKVSRINAGEDSQIPSLHLLGLPELLDALADALSLSLPVAMANTHRGHGVAHEFPANAVNHLLLVVGEVPVKDEFN